MTSKLNEAHNIDGQSHNETVGARYIWTRMAVLLQFIIDIWRLMRPLICILFFSQLINFNAQADSHSNPYSNAKRGSASYYNGADIMKALAASYDDEKKQHLNQLGLSEANLIKNRDGATIAERFANSSQTISARVSRNANTGDITIIEKTITSSRGSVTDKWDLSTNTISHTVRQGDKIDTSYITAAKCKPSFEDSTEKANVKSEICPILTDYSAGSAAPISVPAGAVIEPAATLRIPTSQSPAAAPAPLAH